MEITLFGIKIRVELAIACMILGAVICYMLFCSCSLKEGVSFTYETGGYQRAQMQNQRAQMRNQMENQRRKWLSNGPPR